MPGDGAFTVYLNDPAMHGRALFCFRSEDFLSDIRDEEKRRVYVEGPMDEELRELGPEEAERRAAVRRQQLADLKNRIRAPLPPMPLFDGYPCTWEAAGSSRRQEALTSLPKPAVEKNEPPDVGCYGGSGRAGGLAQLGNWILDKLERAILDAPENQEHIAAVRTETRDELAEERGFHERFRLGLRSRRNACVAVRLSTKSAWPAHDFLRKPAELR